MRRTISLIPLALLLMLLLSPSVEADGQIGQTPVRTVAIDASTKEAVWGTTAVFRFGLFNGDNSSSYQISVTVSLDRTDFGATVFPPSVNLGSASFQQVMVNVTPSGGSARAMGTISVRFSVVSPTSGEQTAVVVLEAVPKTAILDVTTSFVAIGFIILIGFLTSWVFERTGVPDTIFLILLGLLIGPLAARYLGIVIISPQALNIVTPYVATLALVMILFDGGLNLNLEAMLKKLGISVLHTTVTFLLSVSVVVVVTHLIFGYPLVIGLLLGAVVGGTSGAVVVTLVRKMHIQEDTKMILVLESVITDVLCVVLALAMVEYISDGPGASLTSVLPRLAAGFSIGIVVALAVGVVWLKAITRMSGKPFAYMVTLAMLLVMYAAVEMVGGSGVMAALVFGLVLGNHEEISRMFKMKPGLFLDDNIKHFQSELAFVLKTFFFVLLGLMFSLDLGGYWNVSTALPILSNLNGTFMLVLFGVVFVFLGFLLVRSVTSSMTCRLHKESRGDRGAVLSMMDRGLTAAVLASVPFAVASFTNPADPSYLYYRSYLGPFQPQFLNVTFLIIMLTSVATTVGIAARERRIRKERQPHKEVLRKHSERDATKRWKEAEAERYRQRVRQHKETGKSARKK